MKENKAYVVTAGEYSDYRIEGIFSSREKAEEYINHSTDKDLNGIDEKHKNGTCSLRHLCKF